LNESTEPLMLIVQPPPIKVSHEFSQHATSSD